MSLKIKEESPLSIKIRLKSMNKFLTPNRTNWEKLNNSFWEGTVTSETCRKRWMSKGENQCLTKIESEISSPSWKKKSDKLHKITRTLWLYKGRANWLQMKLKDSGVKWKEKEDKPWLINNSLTRRFAKCRKRTKDYDKSLKASNSKFKNIKMTPKILKKKVNNLRESLNKWVDKATFNRNSLMR